MSSAATREQLGMQLLESARSRVRVGAASDVELNLAEVERGRVRHERMEAELATLETLNQVRQLLQLPPGSPLTLTTPLASPRLRSDPLDQLLQEAVARREELRVLRASRSQLDAMVVRLRREVVPSPTFFFDLQSQQPGQLYLGGGVGFALPMWRTHQGELAVVAAEKRRAAEELQLTSYDVTLEVRRAYDAARLRSEEAILWRELIRTAEANVELVNQGWRAGKFDLFRVVQVAREAGEARRRQLEVLGALWYATIELDRATGAL
jgi:outer membrane protein TolC